MRALDSHLGKFGITARLFALVNNMSQEKQFILLKTLLGSKVALYLFKLVIDMPETQQQMLLEKLDESPFEEMPVKTISLDNYESSMRRNPRKTCLIKVKCNAGGKIFESYIIDISPVGVFIETKDNLAQGQEIKLTFLLTGHPSPIRVDGKIVWSKRQGFGVKFDQLTPRDDKAIRDFIDRK